MARITYTSLLVNFSIGAASKPTQTQIGTLITAYYKKCYTYCYGLGTYSADESTDELSIIDTDEFRQELSDLLSHKVQKWNEAGKGSDGVVRPMPKFDLYYENEDEYVRKQFVNFLDEALTTKNENVSYIDNCRLWGSDYSDWSGVYY